MKSHNQGVKEETFIQTGRSVTEQTWGGGGGTIYYYRKVPPFSLWGFPPHLLGSLCPLPKERCLLMPETGEKERNYLFKSYTDLE